MSDVRAEARRFLDDRRHELDRSATLIRALLAEVDRSTKNCETMGADIEQLRKEINRLQWEVFRRHELDHAGTFVEGNEGAPLGDSGMSYVVTTYVCSCLEWSTDDLINYRTLHLAHVATLLDRPCP